MIFSFVDVDEVQGQWRSVPGAQISIFRGGECGGGSSTLVHLQWTFWTNKCADPSSGLRQHSTEFRMRTWRENIGRRLKKKAPCSSATYKPGSPSTGRRRAAPSTPRERELPRPSARSLSCHLNLRVLPAALAFGGPAAFASSLLLTGRQQSVS
jgi:hypothetical protein